MNLATAFHFTHAREKNLLKGMFLSDPRAQYLLGIGTVACALQPVTGAKRPTPLARNWALQTQSWRENLQQLFFVVHQLPLHLWREAQILGYSPNFPNRRFGIYISLVKL